MPSHNSRVHTMKDEHTFIQGLGRKPWCSVDRRLQNPITRRQLLVGYLEACKCRCNWGGLNGTAIIATIEKEIHKEAIHGN
jgi:hypothetical protein